MTPSAVVTGLVAIVVIAVIADKQPCHTEDQFPWILDPPDVSNVTAEDVAHIFNLMVRYGETEKNKKRLPKDTNQFIVVFVAKPSEVRQQKCPSERWEELPTLFLSNNTERAVFFLNNETCSDDPKHALHGEIMAIEYGHIDCLVDNFKLNEIISNREEWPMVFVYSHYIPCSKVTEIGYSCAEELMNFARSRKDRISVFVAYNDSYIGKCVWWTGRQTDEAYSLGVMQEGGIVVFKKKNESQYEQVVKYSAARTVEPTTTFQYEVFRRLESREFAACCNASDQSKIISFLTNDIAYRCTSESSRLGLLTERGKEELRKCAEDILKQEACPSHETCDTLQHEFTGILREALNVSMWSVLPGQPYPIDDPYSGAWKPFDGAWKDLYRQSPMEDVKNDPILCKNDSIGIWPQCPVEADTSSVGNDFTRYEIVLISVLASVLAAVVTGAVYRLWRHRRRNAHALRYKGLKNVIDMLDLNA